MTLMMTSKQGFSGNQRGLSLVELLIAMALGLILTLGVTQIFLGSSQTYRLTEANSRLQEDLRYSVSTLRREIRSAGHLGCLIGEPFDHLDSTHSRYDPEVHNTGMAVRGWEADGTGTDDSFEITTLETGGGTWSSGDGGGLPGDISDAVIPGTDVLMINGHQKFDLALPNNPVDGTQISTDASSTGIPQGTVINIVASDCSGGEQFEKMNNANAGNIAKGGGNPVGPGNVGPGFENTYDGDAAIFTYSSTAYYIGEGADGEPALFRYRLDGGDSQGAVELVRGVESMQVLFGLGDRRGVDRYVSADSVSDWNDVVSARIALLMRSDDRVVDQEQARSFNLLGTEVTTQSDRRTRIVGNATVAIRNRLE